MQTIDTLIEARWILPIEPADVVLEGHAVAVHDGLIVAAPTREEAARAYAPRERIVLDQHVLMPGLVNAHTHAAMTLLRGVADDLPLMEWLEGHIWPAEQRWVGEQFVRDGSLLAMAEMLRGGVTCFNDMYFFPETVAEAALGVGMRACVGLIVLDFPTVWAAEADEYITKGLAIHDRWRDAPLIHPAFAPHAPYTVSDAPLRRIGVLAEELDLPIHMHLHETVGEIEESVRRHGVRPLARLEGLGLLTPRLNAVHMTRLRDDEIARVAAAGVRVTHCPESNLKLASGLCPLHRLRTAGVRAALGTDGAASNNDLDLFGEMRTAALLAKGAAKDARALPAHEALRMATLDGACALGLEERVGSLLPGKAADLAAVRLDAPECRPLYNVASQLVYAAGRSQVSDVWVAGRRLLRERQLTTLDIDDLMRRVDGWQEKIAARI